MINMKTHIISLKGKKLTRRMVNLHILKFFKTVDFKSNYILIHVNLITEPGNVISLGIDFTLDISKENEINTYKLYLLQCYQQNFLSKNNDERVKKIIFSYIETKKKEYEKNIFKMFASN